LFFLGPAAQPRLHYSHRLYLHRGARAGLKMTGRRGTLHDPLHLQALQQCP
jgi:hypothetical protein